MQTNYFDIIKKPILTEKAQNLKDSQRKVVIEVASWANKYQIAQAVKGLFNVDVEAVNALNNRGKMKRFKQSIGKRSNTKKAYLTFSKDVDIDIFGVLGQERS